MTLALLLTAVGGAWAQTQWTSGDCTVTLSNGTLTVSGKGAMADYTQSDKRPWHNNRSDITSVVVESGVTSVGKNAFESFSNLTSVTLPEDFTAISPYAFSNCSSLQSITIPSTVTSIGEGAFEGCSAMTSVTLPEGLTAIGAGTFSSCSSLTSITIPSTVTSIGTLAFSNCSSLQSITIPSMVTSIGDYAFMSSSAISDVNLYANPDNLTWGNTKMNFKQSKVTKCHVLAEHLSAYQNNFSSVNVTFVGDLEPLPTPIEVTTNAASKQDLFTEASFTMPASDVTVNYTMVRDMQDETNPVAFSGLPSSGKIIVKKGSDGKYQPAEALTIQLIDPLAAAEAQNIIAADGITVKVLVGAENELGAIDYDHDNPITLEAFLADMKPGFYWIKAESTDENSPYDGTVYSQEFLVSNGYELTIAAGEYATFYHNEKLYVEDEDAVLYTIANVTDTEAQLSDAIKVAPAETPLLVYNKSEQDKTFLLIPTTENADEVTPAKEFKGSVSSGELPASSSTADYYALNGKAFVWVKYAIEIGANKCWLQIGDQPAAARAMTRSITGGGDTTNMDDVRWQMEDGNYYDLQGRKVEKPNRKGIYIKGGKKVIVR